VIASESKNERITKEALAHFWLRPNSLKKNSEKIVQFLSQHSFKPVGTLDLIKLNSLLTNLTKDSLVLNHDALAPILFAHKASYISIGLSDHHSEISSKTVKKIYRELAKKRQYIWLQEENHPIPSSLKILLKGKTRYTINTTGTFPTHPTKTLADILMKIQEKK